MQAGRLRHQITLYEVIETREVDGTLTQSEVPLDTVWAAVDPIRGREFFALKQVQSDISVKITMRYRAGITPKCRVQFGEKTYDVRDVINWQERGIFLELMCTEHG